MQGLEDQIIISGNVATLTSAELDLLQRTLQRLCMMHTPDKSLISSNGDDLDLTSYDDVSSQFIENEYTNDSFSIERRGSSNSNNHRSMSVVHHRKK
jgi:hypothetical protein